jgi:hypothetical protein
MGAVMSYYEDTLEAIRKEMAGEPAETQVEYRMDCVLRELDEFMAMAANPETVDLVAKNKRLMGMIITRSQLIGSFLLCRETIPGLRVVQNG